MDLMLGTDLALKEDFIQGFTDVLAQTTYDVVPGATGVTVPGKLLFNVFEDLLFICFKFQVLI